MSFKVIDKRHSASDNSEKTESKEEKENNPTVTQKEETFEVDFSSFIVSIATSAMVALGEIPSPVTEKTEANLDVARYNINLLSLLKEKTKNNVTLEEENLIDNILYTLRMKFVEKKGL